MDDDEDEKPLRCVACRRDLQQGEDVTILQDGVLGPRGFVPLEARRFFCSWKCLERHFCDEPVERIKRRIP